jgi:cAMP-binding proteins - catabolite gene activator and regulatory subunit of cAMP-dependent protein kinases
MAAAVRYLKSQAEFRQFPARRFVNFDLVRPPSYISARPAPSKTLPDGTMVWRIAESDADKLRGEPLSIRYPDIEKRLAAHPFLKGMTRHHIELLALCAAPTQFDPGTRSSLEGEPASGFYLVETGKVVLEGETSDGRQSSLTPSPPGNPWDGRGYSRPISGILLHGRPSSALPSASLVHYCDNIARMILL